MLGISGQFRIQLYTESTAQPYSAASAAATLGAEETANAT